jgi:hypothetical protein
MDMMKYMVSSTVEFHSSVRKKGVQVILVEPIALQGNLEGEGYIPTQKVVLL